ncbi:hypothetical protein MLD38_030297 [Melastoma candidum]|uniref:Uncharacterized protein n=1 Tax=Melastoma candidum TaxID=119954 RepID=A0ACB9MRG7_9MYRT|nr:hypothetical protein MLD38_030297 [Melastoma candidum]
MGLSRKTLDRPSSPTPNPNSQGMTEAQLKAAEQQVLAEIVRLTQKHELKGTEGGWKEFLNVYDKEMGDRVSDPSKKSKNVLVAFLKTFSSQNARELFSKVLRCHQNRSLVKQFSEAGVNDESPVQRLVRQTLEHPLYPIEYSFPSCDEGWVVTKLSQRPKNMASTAMLAIDCEMVLCEDGTDACVKVCVVDRNLEVKLNKLVNPGKAISDYRTAITGVSAEDLVGIECSLVDVQKIMKKLLSHGTILAGHALSNDLDALKFDYARIIDTSYIFKYAEDSIQKRPSLTTLCQRVLDYQLRKEGAPHNCLDDATAVMKLVLAVVDHGASLEIPYVPDEVFRSETEMLLVHRIPSTVTIDELNGTIPGIFTVEMKQSRKIGGKYSAFAIFKTVEDANEAFGKLKGTVEKDSQGRKQKVITFQLKTGDVISLCVRQVLSDETTAQASAKKRAGETMMAAKPKKLREEEVVGKNTVVVDPSNDHLKEMERLKRELNEKDLKLRGRCEEHFKEIEVLKEALSNKDLEISSLRDTLKTRKEKLKVLKKTIKSNA